MRLAACRIFRFRLRLRRPLTLKDRTLHVREGLVVKLTSDSGHVGYGETVPLPGFSSENTDTALKELSVLRTGMCDREVPPGLAKLDGAFEGWLSQPVLSPSVRFGFESATLHLLANHRGVTLPQLLSPAPSSSVSINGLLSGSAKEIEERAAMLLRNGYTAFKIKMGGFSADEAVAIVRTVRAVVGDEVPLRLDANRAFSYKDALSFFREVSQFSIDYVEEPVKTLDQLRKLITDDIAPVPVAMDESLLEITPEELSSLSAVKAVVLKPTMLGLERAMCFARAAIECGVAPVISSSFESSLGIATLASLAAVVNTDNIPAGLDTLDWYAEDLFEHPPPIRFGQMNLAECHAVEQRIRTEILEEI